MWTGTPTAAPNVAERSQMKWRSSAYCSGYPYDIQLLQLLALMTVGMQYGCVKIPFRNSSLYDKSVDCYIPHFVQRLVPNLTPFSDTESNAAT
jgi:hypothetical protein